MAAGTRDAAEIAVAFSRVLRGAGVAVPTSATISFAEALDAVGLADRDVTFWTGRATLIRRREDHDVYERAFKVFFDRDRGAAPAPEEPPIELTLAVDDDDTGEAEGDAGAGDDQSIELRFSAVESLRRQDFSTYTDDELAEAQALMSRLRLVGSPRRSLRLGDARGQTQRPDLRRTVRAAMRSAGEPLRRHYRERSTRHRRLVLIIDVSGSMEPYARALLRFVQAAVAGRQKVEAFALGTRLTRLTRELATRNPDEALARAAERVVDYGGGTRLGAGLRTFNDEWGQRGMSRGSIIVVMSDGWDRGEPEVLAEQMERMHRVAHRIIWVNPLKVTPGYAPLARGMAAALPHVDAFVEGHSIDALEHLATEIGAG